MNKTQRDWIFEENYRAPNSGNASGSGLGLAVVRILCEKTNMTCHTLEPTLVDNRWIQTFELKIPIKRVDCDE